MNLTDYLLTGGAMLTWWVIPIMLAVGFVTPWPYNYWTKMEVIKHQMLEAKKNERENAPNEVERLYIEFGLLLRC